MGLEYAVNHANFSEPVHEGPGEDSHYYGAIRQEWKHGKAENSVAQEEAKLHDDAPEGVACVFCEHFF